MVLQKGSCVEESAKLWSNENRRASTADAPDRALTEQNGTHGKWDYWQHNEWSETNTDRDSEF